MRLVEIVVALDTFDETIARAEEYAPPPLMKGMIGSGRLGRKTARGFHDYDGGVEAVAPGAAGSIPSARCRSSAPGPGIARTLPGDSRWWQCEQVSSGEVSWSQSRCHQLRGGPSSPGAWASPHAVSAMSTGPRS